MLELRILGPLEVLADRVPIPLGGAKQRATLAILLLNANRVVSVDRLADDLYAHDAPVTALKQVQRQISDLRKVLGTTAIETRSPGYLIRLEPDQLDLTVFERSTHDATEALAAGEAARAAELLRGALDLWRGPPLADLTYEPFARVAIERLEEMRLAALEERIDADLELGRDREIVPELEQLVADHPLRERFHAQLMLALYRSGRQADALTAYRSAREALVDELGLEPTRALQELERRILSQDPALEPQPQATARSAAPDRTVLLAPGDERSLDLLMSVVGPLLSGMEVIAVRLVSEERELEEAAATLDEWRRTLGANVRAAAFTTADPSSDVVRLASAYDAELVLLGAPPALGATPLPPDVEALLTRSPADAGFLHGGPIDWAHGSGVFVPFGGSEHDWAALELGASFAAAAGTQLRLVGTRADPRRGQRDASRLLANASLAVQRLTGVTARPLLAEATSEALVDAVGEATLVVVGVSPRWRREGIGSVRRALVAHARPPLAIVHRGPRPGALAPRDARTRFSWSLEP